MGGAKESDKELMYAFATSLEKDSSVGRMQIVHKKRNRSFTVALCHVWTWRVMYPRIVYTDLDHLISKVGSAVCSCSSKSRFWHRFLLHRLLDSSLLVGGLYA